MASKLLTVEEVAAMVGVDPKTITSYKARGQMPAPDKQYGRTPLWRESTIERWRPSVTEVSQEVASQDGQ